MPINSTTVSVDVAPQTNGLRRVRETHTDHEGRKHEFLYWLHPNDDANEIATRRVAGLVETLGEREYARKVERIAPLSLQWLTAAQFADYLRAEYRDTKRERAAYLAWWIVEMVSAGHLTDVQVRNAFGMTTPQYTDFKTNRLIPRHDAWASVQLAEGE